MLQAHSLLWYYLWVAPSVLLLVLAFLMWRRRLHVTYPFFLAFAVTSAVEQLTLCIADLVPSVAAEAWWKIFWAGLLVEALVKFAVIGEIFAHVFDAYSSLANLGKILIRGVGAALVLAAALAAAYAQKDSPFPLINGAHVLQQTVFLIETGLLLFIFVFAGYFHIKATRPVFGIALGFAISGCVHLATWAILANATLPSSKRILFDFVNMGTYHGCVLLWFYYLLVPKHIPPKPPDSPPPPEGPLDLEVWNQELERLLHR